MLRRKSTIFVLTLFFSLLTTLILGILSTQKEQTKQVQGQSIINTPILTDTSEETDEKTSPAPQPSARTSAIVDRVVDGDTLKIQLNGKIETLRIIGIDTPETVDPRKPVQCFGAAASTRAKKLLTGKQIELESDPTQGDRDKYQRMLRYVFIDNIDYGLTTIQEGYAHEYTYAMPYKYQSLYKAAQRDAELKKRGLWAENACP